MWQHGGIPTELGQTILVLFPKVNTDTRWVGLVGTLCKVAEAIINTFIKVCINFHFIFHGFHVGRVMETAILELKIDQELASINQYPLFLILLNLHKVYVTMDWGRLLTSM